MRLRNLKKCKIQGKEKRKEGKKIERSCKWRMNEREWGWMRKTQSLICGQIIEIRHHILLLPLGNTIEIIEYIECSCVDCTCSGKDRENIARSAIFSIYIAADLGNKKISFPFSHQHSS
jgi:hypothetical protein